MCHWLKHWTSDWKGPSSGPLSKALNVQLLSCILEINVSHSGQRYLPNDIIININYWQTHVVINSQQVQSKVRHTILFTKYDVSLLLCSSKTELSRTSRKSWFLVNFHVLQTHFPEECIAKMHPLFIIIFLI